MRPRGWPFLPRLVPSLPAPNRPSQPPEPALPAPEPAPPKGHSLALCPASTRDAVALRSAIRRTDLPLAGSNHCGVCISFAPAVDGPGRCSPAVTGLPPQSGHRAEWFSCDSETQDRRLSGQALTSWSFHCSPRCTSCRGSFPSEAKRGVPRRSMPLSRRRRRRRSREYLRCTTIVKARRTAGKGNAPEPGHPTGPFLGLCTASTCDATALCSRMGSKGLLRRGVKHGIGASGVPGLRSLDATSWPPPPAQARPEPRCPTTLPSPSRARAGAEPEPEAEPEPQPGPSRRRGRAGAGASPSHRSPLASRLGRATTRPSNQVSARHT